MMEITRARHLPGGSRGWVDLESWNWSWAWELLSGSVSDGGSVSVLSSDSDSDLVRRCMFVITARILNHGTNHIIKTPDRTSTPPPNTNPFITDVEDDPHHQQRHCRAEPLPAVDSDPRFKMETPSPDCQGSVDCSGVFSFWLAFNLRKGILDCNRHGYGRMRTWK